MISAGRGFLDLIASNPGFVVMFLLVIVAARLATKASVRAISIATIAALTGMIWTTGFPFWESGRTLTLLQLAVGSAVGCIVISVLAVAIDRYALPKRLP